MANVGAQRAGRSWEVNGSKRITSLKRPYIVKLDGGLPLGTDGELASLPGVPAIGSTHPTHTDLRVVGYSVREQAGASKNVLEVEVSYEAPESAEQQQQEQEQGSPVYACEKWGWDDGTEQRDVIIDKDGKPVLNSAQDPFDQAVRAEIYAPVFTKVMKFKQRQSGALAYNCIINGQSVTVGGVSFAARTLLCKVTEERIFGDPDFNYRYSVKLKFKTNKQKIEQAEEETEIGWDAAVVDAGMRQWNETSGEKELIKFIDHETKKVMSVTSPALLDGNGGQLVPESQTATPDPYVMRFRLYDTGTFPSWFYSEPSLPNQPQQNQGNQQ